MNAYGVFTPLEFYNASLELLQKQVFRSILDLAPNMATTREMIMNMHKHERDTRFALFAKDQTPGAIEFSIPLGTLEKRQKMSDAEHAQLLTENSKRISAPADRELFRSSMKQQRGQQPPLIWRSRERV